jgi:hypothetical protein
LAEFISLSLLSSLHNARNSVRWVGPAVAALGLLLTVLITLTGQQNFFGQWPLSQALGPGWILPVVGLGFAFGLVSLRIFVTALALFMMGIVGGFAAYDRVVFLLYIVWEVPSQFSVTGPISCLVVGLPLLSPARLRAWLLPLAAFVAGTMLALDILLNDPSQGDPLFTFSPLVVACWTIIAVALTVRAFRHNWLVIFGRILGSWTVAIGVLYGGASIALVFSPTLSSSAISREPAQGAESSPSVESRNAVGGKTAGNPPWRTLWQRPTHGKFEVPQP